MVYLLLYLAGLSLTSPFPDSHFNFCRSAGSVRCVLAFYSW
jgi:hypothetical protein